MTKDDLLSKGGFGLPDRLKSRASIELLFETGRKFSKRPLVLLLADSGSDRPSEWVFTAPKRRYRKAVDRNRIKRKLREALRLEWPEAPAILKSGKFLALISTAELEVSVSTLRESLRGLWKQIQADTREQAAVPSV